MSVYFVYRSGYDAPLGHRLIVFNDENLDAWLRRNWLSKRDVPEELVTKEGYVGPRGIVWRKEIDGRFLDARTEAIFGGIVYGFEYLWGDMYRSRLPRSSKKLVSWLNAVGYPEGRIYAKEHALQIATNDDERDLVIMMFDDDFLFEHPQRVAYLLHKELDLPGDVGQTAESFQWNGNFEMLNNSSNSSDMTWCVLNGLERCNWLSSPVGVFRFDGIALKGLPRELRKPVVTDHEQWPSLLRMLRYLAFRYPELSVQKLMSTWIELNPLKLSEMFSPEMDDTPRYDRYLGTPSEAFEEYEKIGKLVAERATGSHHYTTQFSDQLIRISYHCDEDRVQDSEHLSIYVFDNAWASSHPELAASLLHFGSQGQCLFEVDAASFA